MTIAPTTAPANTNPSGTSTVGFNDLRSEDFFALMIAQLQAQDPLKPQDNQQLLSQMSNIRQIEQSTRLSDTLDAQVKALESQTEILDNLSSEKFSEPASLIGLYVLGPAVDEAGEPIAGEDGHQTKAEGVVLGLEYNDEGKAILKLHTGESVFADTVEKVKIVVPDDGTEENPEGPTGQNPAPTAMAGAKLKSLELASSKQNALQAAGQDPVSTLLQSMFTPRGAI
ncbi:MAG TPA: flagellar hook capping FlgD N-terminal domain-containing protein [Phycisphaerae bacterium]|nr:flagellar hook capping FlgD N-terminal domain-containing protein [Phycisphaerae bacterium]